MDRREFFKLIFGENPNGWICIRGIYFKTRPGSANAPYHRWASTFEEADQYIEEMQAAGREPYYVPGIFKKPGDKYTGAEVFNVKSHRSFFMDIDCGEGVKKPYKTQKEGLAALQQFMADTKLPMPTLVSSGYGIHCYWVVDEDVPYDLWKPIAMALKAKGHEYKFKTDQRVVGDGASLMRPPDSFNTKNYEDPRKVKVRYMAPVLTLDAFRDIIPPVLTHATTGVAPDALTASLMGEYPSCSFDVLLKKSLATKTVKVPVKKVVTDKDGKEHAVLKEEALEVCAGCQQIRKCYVERETLDYDLWLLALAVAYKCTDAETAIHTISEGHPTYKYDDIVKKAATLDGTTTCLKFQQQNPDDCNGCIHRQQGKIKAPISLGRAVEFSSASDNIITNVVYEGLAGERVIEAPIAYPAPWARPKQGGIVRRDFDDPVLAEEAGESMETFVYANDLWVKQLLEDDDSGASLHMVHVRPNGPKSKRVDEFIVTYEEATKAEALQKRLAHFGVHGAFLKTTATLLQQYVQAWVAKLEKEAEAGIARAHYGWHGSSFVVGKREYLPHMLPAYSPPSKATENTVEAFDPVGELATWTQMADLYGAKGNEAKAFILFVGFGAPLYRFTKQGSCLIHLTNKDSGVGKSTNQKVAASIWGDPSQLMLLKTDTDNARYHMFGVLRHLPIFIDEITNMDAESLSELAYRISENRGKHRQYSHSNSLRKNDTKWETMIVSSGNNSLYDTLKQHKINLGGEMNRIIELPLDVKDTLTQEEGSYWYEHVLSNNYGTAGHIYAQYLADNQEDFEQETFQCYQDYVQKFNFKREHRFFRAACAAAFTGARIAKALGLHNIDVDAVERWAIEHLGNITASVKEAADQDSLAMLGRFINEHKRNELIVNKGQVVAGGLMMSEIPLKESYGALIMRMEREAGILYINCEALRSWCGKHRAHYEPLISDLTALGIVIAAKKDKRLAEGTPSPGLPVKCLWVDMTAVEKLNSSIAQAASAVVQ